MFHRHAAAGKEPSLLQRNEGVGFKPPHPTPLMLQAPLNSLWRSFFL